jgi:S-DNA-T family DNA segregation ATPase FtsK/SpoIIIE
MRERLRNSTRLWGAANLWSTGPSVEHPLVIVVIDECQAYLDNRSLITKEDRAVGVEIDALVRDLVKRGRSAGVLVVLSTQRPTADAIPTAIRDNANLRVCFGVRTREAAAAVLGEFSVGSEVSPIGSRPGVGVAVMDGDLVRFRAPLVRPEEIRREVAASRCLTPDPVDLLGSERLVGEAMELKGGGA